MHALSNEATRSAIPPAGHFPEFDPYDGDVLATAVSASVNRKYYSAFAKYTAWHARMRAIRIAVQNRDDVLATSVKIRIPVSKEDLAGCDRMVIVRLAAIKRLHSCTPDRRSTLPELAVPWLQ